MEAIENNTNNVDTIIMLYKIMFFSEKVVNYIQESDYIGIFVDLYEKLVIQTIREYENPDRVQHMNDLLKNYFYTPTDFQSNLAKHLQSIGAQNLDLNLPGNNDDDGDNLKPTLQLNFEPAPTDPYPGNGGTNNPNSEQSSFYMPTGMTPNHASQKAIRVPILNLPSSYNENAAAVSRSTRRADPYRSFSTYSNRLSNYGVGSNSIDYGNRDSIYHKNEGNHNMSLDNETSYFYDADNFKIATSMTAGERMKQLANQLGEYCLTIDLGCLLAQKRKSQLDKGAKISAAVQGNILYNIADLIRCFRHY